MAEPQQRRMSVEQFLDWCETQEDRYELIAGRPVLKDTVPPEDRRPGLMAGAKRRHDRVVVNAITALEPQLRDGPCSTFTGGIGVRTAIDQVHRPDVGVECAGDDMEGQDAADARLAIEVLSPSTRRFDYAGKLTEYQRLETLRYIVLVNPRAVAVSFSRRDEGGWVTEEIEDRGATLDLPEIGARLAVADLYRGVTLDPSM